MLARQLADLGLGHAAQRKDRAAQLFLRKSEQEVGLILRQIRRPLQQPSPRLSSNSTRA